ncbi:senescence associated gene 20-like [Andrographis paniculata]|uniref:senescence associated gene 20-like n=1 Tax=Andrographis paniculata TaxID=175694 RepID=UPI0021E790AA|nr:senescence associated gene 20-like [Andrographis paniculata]
MTLIYQNALPRPSYIIHFPFSSFPHSPFQFLCKATLISLTPSSQTPNSQSQELAIPQFPEAPAETTTKAVVTALYDALNARDAETIQKILAADLEWWFHGPPSHQFLMRLLTGELQESSFRFVPHSISAFGSTVLAEGFDESRSVAWVHAWTVTDGIITQVKEYSNTSLTVTRIGNTTDQSGCVTTVAAARAGEVWQSSLPDLVGKSVPGLVLAI